MRKFDEFEISIKDSSQVDDDIEDEYSRRGEREVCKRVTKRDRSRSVETKGRLKEIMLGHSGGDEGLKRHLFMQNRATEHLNRHLQSRSRHIKTNSQII